MRRQPDRIYRFTTEGEANRWLGIAQRNPKVERAWVLHDKGLMVGPRLVRPEHWQLKVYFKPGCVPEPKPTTRQQGT